MIVQNNKEEKKHLRKRLFLQRAQFLATEPAKEQVLQLINTVKFFVFDKIHNFHRPMIIGGVWPLYNEVDLRPLLYQFDKAGIIVSFPVIVAKGRPLKFAQWSSFSRLCQGVHKTNHPIGPFVEPDLFLVPLLGFSRMGYRIGYGGGYYDRTLSVFSKKISVGYGFSWQEIPDMPYECHDRALSFIVTEREIIKTE